MGQHVSEKIHMYIHALWEIWTHNRYVRVVRTHTLDCEVTVISKHLDQWSEILQQTRAIFCNILNQITFWSSASYIFRTLEQ
jgi:hypothetical protein